MTTSNIRDHINTHNAALVLKYVYDGNFSEMAKHINNVRESLGHATVTENTVRRYCDGGSGYDGGPPPWFASIVEMLLVARMR